jgi:hypothetical protein
MVVAIPVPGIRIDTENIQNLIESPMLPEGIGDDPVLKDAFLDRRHLSRYKKDGEILYQYRKLLGENILPISNDDISGFDVSFTEDGILRKVHHPEKGYVVEYFYRDPLSFLYYNALRSLDRKSYEALMLKARVALHKNRPVRDGVFVR